MHYDEEHDSYYNNQFQIHSLACENRQKLLEDLSPDEMIKILFKHHLDKLNDYKVNELKKEFDSKNRGV